MSDKPQVYFTLDGMRFYGLAQTYECGVYWYIDSAGYRHPLTPTVEAHPPRGDDDDGQLAAD